MSSKAQKYSPDKAQIELGTSHYLDQLNRVYARPDFNEAVSWERLDEEHRIELVVKFLFSIQKIEVTQWDEVKEELENMFARDDDFVEAVLKFMRDEELITVKAGKIHLTPAGRDVLKG